MTTLQKFQAAKLAHEKEMAILTDRRLNEMQEMHRNMKANREFFAKNNAERDGYMAAIEAQ